MPNFTKEFILTTDACDWAVGAFLAQIHDEILRPNGYFSKGLSKAQKKYPKIEKELLAIVLGIEFFHEILYGRHFIVITDHKPLIYLLKKKEHVAQRLQRWILKMQIYEFEIRYIPGKLNNTADGLSRMPDDDESITITNENEDEEDTIIAMIEINNE
jgi:hypothetical protein